MPPHTFGELSPASFATSTKVTGDAAVGFEIVAASSRALRFHFQSGVASASRSVLPRRVADEPRNRRRGNFIYWLSLARFWKWMRHDSCAFLYRDDFVGRHVGQFLHQTARPGDFEGIDSCALAEAEENARIACGHITHAAFGLFDVRNSFGGELQRRTDAVAIRFCADEQNLQPVIGVA